MKFRLLAGMLWAVTLPIDTVRAQNPVPIIDNPLYLGWPQVVGTKA